MPLELTDFFMPRYVKIIEVFYSYRFFVSFLQLFNTSLVVLSNRLLDLVPQYFRSYEGKNSSIEVLNLP